MATLLNSEWWDHCNEVEKNGSVMTNPKYVCWNSRLFTVLVLWDRLGTICVPIISLTTICSLTQPVVSKTLCYFRIKLIKREYLHQLIMHNRKLVIFLIQLQGQYIFSSTKDFRWICVCVSLWFRKLRAFNFRHLCWKLVIRNLLCLGSAWYLKDFRQIFWWRNLKLRIYSYLPTLIGIGSWIVGQ